MLTVETCIGNLPEELREAAIAAQQERKRTGNRFYPYLTAECVETLKDEDTLIVWPLPHSFYFILADKGLYIEVPESEYPLSSEQAQFYLQQMIPWTQEIGMMVFDA